MQPTPTIARQALLAAVFTTLSSHTPALAQEATPTPSSSPTPTASPAPPPPSEIPRPTGGQFRLGKDEGFGLGGLDPEPTALYGPNRVPAVLPDNGSLSTVNLSGYYSVKPADNQRFLLEIEGDYTQFGLDASYYIKPKDWAGSLTANFFIMAGRNQSYEGGANDVGLRRPYGSNPWLHQLGGGVEYTQAVTSNLTLAGALNYRQTSVSDGAFNGRVLPYDQFRNPLTLSPTGIDDLLSLRIAGLYSTLDDKQFPTSGTKLRFSAEQTIPVGSAQMNSTRLGVNFTQFFPVSLFQFSVGQPTLIFNVQAGTILGDLPGYDAFNLGGVNSVRGWDQGDMATARSFMETTLEYRFPIAEPDIFGHTMPMRGAFFADYGTDFGTAGQVFGQPGVVRAKAGEGAGIGAGFHVLSPVGLLRLESAVSNTGAFQVYLTIGDRY